MRIIKSIIVAFSMYSRIPMPRFNWASDDMKYHLIFFPWVGAVIGAVEYLWLLFCEKYEVSHIAFTLIALAIPLILTGGFHLDGFMDTSDALSSYQEKEKRLEILKDPHIGAFAVIKVCIYGLIMTASVYSMDKDGFLAWLFMFFIARAVSGICVIKSKKAKSNGILNTEAKTASDRAVVFGLALQLVIVAMAAGALYQYYWTMCMAALAIEVVYYIYTAYSKFGGVTGDLAGWFVCKAELLAAVFVALYTIILK
ncbi:MAG: adenosylcobinamide-GDP ribazoletransferase [Pseudobutyrivibrio sp.]|nr:adenosylcobinamide-GDP ribazoletransferase [Pseudobutyrivibrio sp.]